MFRRTPEAVFSNSKILAAFKGDLGAAIAAHKDSPVNYGSKFGEIAPLKKIIPSSRGQD